MRDYLEISSTPNDEPCIQVGAEDYAKFSKLECEALIAQIRRQFGAEPEGVRLFRKACPHDFGTYYEVAIEFEEGSEEQQEYAYRVEGQTSENWDEEALQFLTQNNYPFDKLM